MLDSGAKSSVPIDDAYIAVALADDIKGVIDRARFGGLPSESSPCTSVFAEGALFHERYREHSTRPAGSGNLPNDATHRSVAACPASYDYTSNNAAEYVAL